MALMNTSTALDEEEELRNRTRYVKSGASDSDVKTALDPATAVPVALPPPSSRNFDYTAGVLKPTKAMFTKNVKKGTPNIYGGRDIGSYTTQTVFDQKGYEQALKYYDELKAASAGSGKPSLEALDSRRFEQPAGALKNAFSQMQPQDPRQVFDAYYAAHGIEGVNHVLAKTVTSKPTWGEQRGGYGGPVTSRVYNQYAEKAVDTGNGYRIDPAPQRKKSGLHGVLDKAAPYVAGALFGVITGGIAAGAVGAAAGTAGGTAAGTAGGTTGGTAVGGATAAAGQGVTYSQYAASLGYGSGTAAGASGGSLAGYYAANTTAISNAGTQVGMAGATQGTSTALGTAGKIYKGVEVGAQAYGLLQNQKASKMLEGQMAADRAAMNALMQEETSSKAAAPIPSAQAMEEARRREAAKMRGKKRGRQESMLSDPSRTALG